MSLELVLELGNTTPWPGPPCDRPPQSALVEGASCSWSGWNGTYGTNGLLVPLAPLVLYLPLLNLSILC